MQLTAAIIETSPASTRSLFDNPIERVRVRVFDTVEYLRRPGVMDTHNDRSRRGRGWLINTVACSFEVGRRLAAQPAAETTSMRLDGGGKNQPTHVFDAGGSGAR